MVKNPGAASSFGSIRALNQPVLVGVITDTHETPKAMKLNGRFISVESVADCWRIDDEWWRERPVSRIYYQCSVGPGLQAIVFRDLTSNVWYLQKA